MYLSRMGEPQSESAGLVKISEDGVIVLPVEVREVLGIKNQEAFVRVKDVSVAKVIEEDNDTTLEDAKGGEG
jgi:bifunctional DNA-binding transcriptional regulator/antitoxin component of YhaV-PrlF toxin-antitoxin module